MPCSDWLACGPASVQQLPWKYLALKGQSTEFRGYMSTICKNSCVMPSLALRDSFKVQKISLTPTLFIYRLRQDSRLFDRKPALKPRVWGFKDRPSLGRKDPLIDAIDLHYGKCRMMFFEAWLRLWQCLNFGCICSPNLTRAWCTVVFLLSHPIFSHLPTVSWDSLALHSAQCEGIKRGIKCL